MLFAARLSAVTKKPRLRLTMRRSSSVRPRGFFHSSMSRCMLISCGIQSLAHPARYLSHAHLYLNGTSWLTSAWPLMTRLSSTRTRPKPLAIASRSASRSCTGSRERMPPVTWARIVSGVSPRERGVAGAAVSSSSKLSMGRSPSVHCREALVQELGCEILALDPCDRREPVVEVELREAIAIAQRLEALAVKLVGEVDDAFAAVVELEPHLVIAEIARFDDVPRGILVTSQRVPPFRR